MKIEVKNDAMLGRTNDTTLHIELMKLQQENKQLKEKLDKNTEIYLNASKYGSKMEGKVVVLEYILEELKKWLEEQWKQSQDIWFVKIINKIKELEEGVNNERY